MKAVAYLNPQGAARLFAAAPLTFEQAVDAGRKGQPGGAALNAVLTITSATSHKRTASPNDGGVLHGSDPSLGATSVVRTAAAEFGYTLSPDPMPEENIFVRSDQYSLVKQEVPRPYFATLNVYCVLDL